MDMNGLLLDSWWKQPNTTHFQGLSTSLKHQITIACGSWSPRRVCGGSWQISEGTWQRSSWNPTLCIKAQDLSDLWHLFQAKWQWIRLLQGTPLDSLLCFACQCLLWIRWGISKIGDITQIIHVKSIFYSKPSIHSGTPMTMLNLPCPAQRHRHARRPLRRQWHWLWTVKVSIVVLSNRQKQWSCMTVYPQGDLI